jgi:hypothetical protein
LPPSPRRCGASLIGPALAWQIGVVSLLFLVEVYGIYALAIEWGQSIELARTLAVNTLMVLGSGVLMFVILEIEKQIRLRWRA